ncbi:MAG: hypothetical protein QM608_12655 [Caulobacter sp.]
MSAAICAKSAVVEIRVGILIAAHFRRYDLGDDGGIVLTTGVLDVSGSPDVPPKICRVAEAKFERQGVGPASLGAQLYCRSQGST